MAEENQEEKKETEENTSQKEKAQVGKTIKKYLDKGVEASKKGLKTAGVALSEFGDKSMIHIDIAKLKSRLDKKYQELGKVVSEQLSESQDVTITKDSLVVSEKLSEISDLKNKIHEREEEIKKYDK